MWPESCHPLNTSITSHFILTLFYFWWEPISSNLSVNFNYIYNVLIRKTVFWLQIQNTKQCYQLEAPCYIWSLGVSQSYNWSLNPFSNLSLVSPHPIPGNHFGTLGSSPNSANNLICGQSDPPLCSCEEAALFKVRVLIGIQHENHREFKVF